MQYLIMDADKVNMLIPDRESNSHKGNYGKILLLCGSKGYTGAAALASQAALRSGAGLVYLGVPDCIYEIEAVKLTEPVVFSLPDKEGKISSQAIQLIQQYLPRMDAVLIGPGLGVSSETTAVLEFVIRNYEGPLVIDADGINVISAHKSILRERTCPTILTPHEGEFVRLIGDSIHDRVLDAINAAIAFNCIIVLKGHKTIITNGEFTYINSTGNPGMAVGGSGDVLAGIIVSLIGQGISPLQASACAVWLHGAAGDICAQEIGQYGLLPSDMIKVLPRLLK